MFIDLADTVLCSVCVMKSAEHADCRLTFAAEQMNCARSWALHKRNCTS